MQRTKKKKNTMIQKQYSQRTKKYYEHDQENKGANMQTRLTPTSFYGVAIKETLKTFFIAHISIIILTNYSNSN